MGDAAFCAQRAALTGGPSTSEELDALRARLIEDGYLTTAPSAELAAAVSLKAVREGMRRLVAAGWPATLILMYDEAWVIAHHYGARVSAACGGANVMSFDMLAWLIVPSEGHAGFAPHRDRQPPDVRSSFHGDGSPKYCTAWVALGDADPDTSCLYLIPRGVDPGYDAGDDQAEGAEDPLLALMRSDAAVQSLRACPLPPGGAVVFSHRAMHWGSRGSASCAEPRVSFSFGCTDDAFEPPAFDRAHLPFPPPRLRAALASAQLINYHERFAFDAKQLRTFGRTFAASRGDFARAYAQKVAAELKSAVDDRARSRGAASSAAAAGDDDDDDDDEGAMEDALEAMLDAQMGADDENLFDDFDAECT